MSIDLSKKYQKTDKIAFFDTFLLYCWTLFRNHFGPKCIKKLTNHEIHCWEYFATFDTFLSHFCLSPTKYKLWKLSKMCQKWISTFQKCIKKVTKVCLLTHFCHIFGISCPHCMTVLDFIKYLGKAHETLSQRAVHWFLALGRICGLLEDMGRQSVDEEKSKGGQSVDKESKQGLLYYRQL